MEAYIEIGRVNNKILKRLGIELITDEVVFTYERIEHVQDRRKQQYETIKEVLPIAIYSPDYIYKDWNNRDNTLVFIKRLDKESKLNVVIRIAVVNDTKHPKNSIITIIRVGQKTFKKIIKNKSKNLLYEKLDKNE